MKRITVLSIVLFMSSLIAGCSDDDGPSDPVETVIEPICETGAHTRQDAHTPVSNVSDWGQPVRLGDPVNTPCPQDAIEIDIETGYLYIMYTEDILEEMSADRMLARENNTYRLKIVELPDSFGEPEYFDLQFETAGSFDGELSFDHPNDRVFFHSNRPENYGYNIPSPMDDFLDLYVANLSNGEPTGLSHLSQPPNSIYADGEHAIHPNGTDLYFASLRPDGLGKADIWVSSLSESGWTEPVNLGSPTNSIGEDKQPTFTADGDTMYFVSDRNLLIGSAIYRSTLDGDSWTIPELVISGISGEPSVTPDGRYLYFVHVLTDADGVFDADVWYSERQ